MPSSTSSFEQRLPDGPWPKIWTLAAIIVVVVLGTLEFSLRRAGFVPSVTDDAELWSHVRNSVRADATDEVVILGASRAQLGFDTDVFADSFAGRKPVQLAIDGSSCVPVLNQLSHDEHFKGLVICDVLPGAFFSGVSLNAGKQAEYLQVYEQQSAAASIEQALRIWVQSHLVIRLPEVSVGRLLDELRRFRLPEQSYVVTTPDRNRRADYSKVDIAAHRQHREESAHRVPAGVSPDQYAQDLALLKGIVSRIQSRGGRVCFVRLPASGGVRAVEDKLFPREVYWDALGPGTGALTINFADYPELQFDCPDGSHLDAPDARKFSAALAVILREKLAEGTERTTPRSATVE